MRQLTNIEQKKCSLKLHGCAFDMLFKHKNEIFRKLSDIRGIYFIDHIAFHIINPELEEAVFSITPSVEYNLITHNLWQDDGSFVPFQYVNDIIFWWKEAYKNESAKKLILLKEIKHGFSLGFSLVKKIGEFYLVYSFASRNSEANLKEYYRQKINELFHIGEYGYKLIRDIYFQYCDTHFPPEAETVKPLHPGPRQLRLIIPNEQ